MYADFHDKLKDCCRKFLFSPRSIAWEFFLSGRTSESNLWCSGGFWLLLKHSSDFWSFNCDNWVIKGTMFYFQLYCMTLPQFSICFLVFNLHFFLAVKKQTGNIFFYSSRKFFILLEENEITLCTFPLLYSPFCLSCSLMAFILWSIPSILIGIFFPVFSCDKKIFSSNLFL